MRTKTLILTAAFGLAGAASSMAQVYSVNAVGYMNVEIPTGFIMIANQLDNGAGNMLKDLIPTAPAGTIVYKFNPDTGAYNSSISLGTAWTVGDMTMNPGEGAFVRNTSESSFTVTFVGEVPQGTLDLDLPMGFSIASSIVPQELDLSTPEANFPTESGDILYTYQNDTGTYRSAIALSATAWTAPPVVKVGEGWFINKKSAQTWTRTFSVND